MFPLLLKFEEALYLGCVRRGVSDLTSEIPTQKIVLD
jgi:hypothetical protein